MNKFQAAGHLRFMNDRLLLKFSFEKYDATEDFTCGFSSEHAGNCDGTGC